MIKLSGFLETRLADGLLCCFVLALGYVLPAFFPAFFVDEFSSSIYLLLWMNLFVWSLLWTFREKGTRQLPSELTDWQIVAAFLLIVSDQVYILMPKEVHDAIAPVLSAYSIPAFACVGLIIAGITKLYISRWRILKKEQELLTLEIKQLQQLIASPPSSSSKGLPFLRKFILNESIALLSKKEIYLLLEGCSMVDPELFAWLKRKKYALPPNYLMLCVLLRMGKTKKEIMAIMGLSDEAYRGLKYRVTKRFELGKTDCEVFVRGIR